MQVKNGGKKGIVQTLKALHTGQRMAVIAAAVVVVGGISGVLWSITAGGGANVPVQTSSIGVSSIEPSSVEPSSVAPSSVVPSSVVPSSVAPSSVAPSSSKATSSKAAPASSKAPQPPKEAAPLPAGFQEKYGDLYRQNNDFVGWINYTGKLDYPIVQGKDNSYYLDKNFKKQGYAWGNPYMDVRVSVGASKNTIIWSHSNPKDGTMFQALKGMRKVDYYKEHPTVQFNSVYADGTYKIIAFFVENTKPGTNFFPYHMFIDQTDEAYINDYIAQAKARSFINTTVDHNATDTFLTLSTCWDTNSANWDRLITVARKVRSGEDAPVDTAGATQNTAQQLPPGGLFSTKY